MWRRSHVSDMSRAVTLSPKMSRASDSVLRESIRAASSPLALPAATRSAVHGRCPRAGAVPDSLFEGRRRGSDSEESPSGRDTRAVAVLERVSERRTPRGVRSRRVPHGSGCVTTHGKRLVWLSHESSVMSNRN